MSKADVLLMVPPGIRSNTPPLGLLYLAAQLEKDRVSIRIMDSGMENHSIDESIKAVEEIDPQIIGLAATTPDIQIVEDFAAVLREARPQTAIVLGGPHPTLDPQNVLAHPAVDFVIRGEAEYSFSEFCRAYLGGERDSFKIDGVSYKIDGEQIHNPDRPMIENLDELPLPARHLLPMSLYRNYGRIYKRKPVQVMISSRGCPFRCIFCAHEIFGHNYRFLSAERMIEEVKVLMHDYGAREILFREDNFTASKERAYKFCELIHKEKLDLSWMALSHCNSIDEKLAKTMVGAGCWHMGLGVESGSPEIQKVLRKNLDLKVAVRAFDTLQKAGMKTLAFFMIGNYRDSAETIDQTIDFARKLNTDFAIFTITTPFPSTELFSKAVDEGLITNMDPTQIFNNPSIFKQKTPVLRTPELEAEQLVKFQKKAIRRFYLRPKQFFRILKSWSMTRAFFHIQPKDYSNNTALLSELRSRAAALETKAVGSSD